jgi:hypothetical protein
MDAHGSLSQRMHGELIVGPPRAYHVEVYFRSNGQGRATRTSNLRP